MYAMGRAAFAECSSGLGQKLGCKMAQEVKVWWADGGKENLHPPGKGEVSV
jgi:hypothetical protein